MVERARKPSAIPVGDATVEDKPRVEANSDSVKLTLPTGESVDILLYGATVTSWKVPVGKSPSGEFITEEKLFLSDKAHLDGSKAVRGGIPLVFPIFGKSDDHPKLAQHGFARISRWEFLGNQSESDSSIQVDFGLGPENIPADVRAVWGYDFGLIYSVTLSTNTLETKIVIQNKGTETFDFQVLFHTYFRVPDVEALSISGLEGLTYRDKVTSSVAEENSSELKITSETDRVYLDASKVVSVSSDIKRLFDVKLESLQDVVVWNPWTGSSNIADFGPEGAWKNMICVEAGSVGRFHKIEGGAIWEGGQVIKLN